MPVEVSEIQGPSAWSRAQISQSDDWIVKLSADHLKELDRLNEALQKNQAGQVRRDYRVITCADVAYTPYEPYPR